MSDVDHSTSYIIYCTYNEHVFSIDDKFLPKIVIRNNVKRGIF